MPPDLGEDQGVDWESLQSAWGLRFPSDYVAFMARYGAGAINDSFSVLVPNAPDQAEDGGKASETRNAVELRDADSVPVVAWGVTVAADIICWKITHEDPEQWPVTVWRRQNSSPRWIEYERGMTGFLCGLFSVSSMSAR
ncbi:SMI1/KNR4 family protein [Streptomyces sp. NBC_00075]|uniref:SMI1/KNR4 family protein n=1 Tax=Streptomyces sp. NBC_00075 TaxID=2975641 RepID=UPI003251584E